MGARSSRSLTQYEVSMVHWRGRGEVLLTGATGFVGQALYPVLESAGYEVRCATRNAERARKRWPNRKWISMDVDDGESVLRALEGCGAAYFLIHRMGEHEDYESQEAAAAMTFLDAATRMGVERVVYLGGVKPPGEPARHLRSRLVTGAILRSGEISTVELRASMIIGAGSASWQIIRDIAMRLPVMVCPRWLKNRTEPVAITDVTAALTGALSVELEESAYFDLPGPEVLSFRQCLERVSNVVGNRPIMVDIPFLSPRLSSYWLKLVTGANFDLARQLVENLKDDLLAGSSDYWSLIEHEELMGFDEMVRRALAEEEEPGIYERAVRNVIGGRPRREASDHT